jgi:hypothetical protein
MRKSLMKEPPRTGSFRKISRHAVGLVEDFGERGRWLAVIGFKTRSKSRGDMTFITRPDRIRWDRDPEYIRNRGIIRAQRRPCARCGGPIAYDQPYWLVINGKRRVNPRAFVAGHIRSGAKGGGHELSNLQPECARCSLRSGGTDGALQRQALLGNAKPIGHARPDTASRW